MSLLYLILKALSILCYMIDCSFKNKICQIAPLNVLSQDLFDLFKSENHIHSKISDIFSFRFLNINCFQVLVVITFKATSVAILITAL